MSSFLSTIHGQQQCSGDHVNGPQFVIRQVLAQDIATVYDLVSAEHWALSPADCQLIHRTQPDGLLGAYTAEDDTLIGVCGMYIVDQETATLGLYIVRPASRGQGVGRSLFQCAMSQPCVRGRSVVLHSAPSLVSTYARYGFATADLTFRGAQGLLSGTGCAKRKPGHGKPGGLRVERIRDSLQEQVAAYRLSVSGARCSGSDDFWREWTCDPEHSISRCAVRGSRVLGYLVIRKRPGHSYFYLSSFYADSLRVAELLLGEVARILPRGVALKCYVPSSNPAAGSLFTRNGLNRTDDADYAQPMYKGYDKFSNVQWDKVYAITNFTNVVV